MNFKKDLSYLEKTKLKEIREFVKAERKRIGVSQDQIGIENRLEGSCFSHGQKTGEFKNLVYSQLIYTRYGYGGWIGLNGVVLDELVEYVRRIKEYRQRQ